MAGRVPIVIDGWEQGVNTAGSFRNSGGFAAAARRVKTAGPPALMLFAIVAAWQLGVFHWAFGLETYIVAYPADIGRALLEQESTVLSDVRVTLYEAFTGYVVGSAIGFTTAVVLTWSGFLRRGVLPLVSAMTSLPIVALAPLMVLYLGFGSNSKIAVVVLMTFPPMTVATFKGLVSVSVESERLMTSFAASHLKTFSKLRLPQSVPFLFTGLRVNVTLSLVGAIIAEFFAARHGVGSSMGYALDSFDMPTAWLYMVAAALLGVVWYRLVQFVEKVAAPWQEVYRTPSA